MCPRSQESCQGCQALGMPDARRVGLCLRSLVPGGADTIEDCTSSCRTAEVNCAHGNSVAGPERTGYDINKWGSCASHWFSLVQFFLAAVLV